MFSKNSVYIWKVFFISSDIHQSLTNSSSTNPVQNISDTLIVQHSSLYIPVCTPSNFSIKDTKLISNKNNKIKINFQIFSSSFRYFTLCLSFKGLWISDLTWFITWQRIQYQDDLYMLALSVNYLEHSFAIQFCVITTDFPFINPTLLIGAVEYANFTTTE